MHKQERLGSPVTTSCRFGCGVIAAASVIALLGCSSAVPATEDYRAISIQPALDQARKAQACVARMGFEINVRPTGDFEYTDKQVPDDQAPLVDAAIAECTKRHPAGRSDPWPRDKLPKLYALELAAAGCIKSLGLAVDDPPSLQRFVDTYGTSHAWSARRSALLGNTVTQEAYDQLTVVCPDPETLGTP